MQRSTHPEYAPNGDRYQSDDRSSTLNTRAWKKPPDATRPTSPHDDATNGAMRRHATRAMRALTRYDDDDDERERCSRARRTNERTNE
jgi:hypothetical protein